LDAGEPFDAVVCSLVLCSVDQPKQCLQQIFSILRPGGELRYLEHIRQRWRSRTAAAAGRRDGVARLFGNCHTHATPSARSPMRLSAQTAKHDLEFAAWVPMPSPRW